MAKDEKEKLAAELAQLEAYFGERTRKNELAESQRPQFIQAAQIIALKKFLVSFAQIFLAAK